MHFKNKLTLVFSRTLAAALSLAVYLPFARAQAPLPVQGVSDRTVYANTVSVRVPSATGYSYGITLDGQRIPADVNLTVTNVDYHELAVSRTNLALGAVTNRLLRFIIRSSERGDSEWGLPPWVPYPAINATAGELAGAHLRILTPQDYPLGLEIPVVAWIENAQDKAVRANALLTAPGHPAIQLRRGAGSGFLAASHPAGALQYGAQVPGLQTNKVIQLESSTTWSNVSGTLSGTVAWPPNSRIAITANITIPASATLTIGEGSIVKLNSRVNITNDGRVVINGTEARPVVFTPVTRAQPWGGFFMRNNSGSVDANAAIFVASGADPTGGAGHKPQQCLFFLDNRPRLALTNCAAIYLAGQFGHAATSMTNATERAWTEVNIVHTLIQRCVTGGEWSGCNLKFLDSALLEVPYATPVFDDADEDGIYFLYGEYQVRDSVLGWTRDDGIDSGSGNGGSVTASNVWVESIYHEAFAWSGGGGTSGTRRTTNEHCVAINCGQGYECGWSSGGASYSPAVYVNDSLAIGNGTGARFGDNYDWSYYGFLQVTNSLLLNNYRDVWGRNWQTDAGGWIYRTANMDLQDNYFTAPNPNHPRNTVWNPATDGWRLAAFMTTPPEAPVGVAFATWTNQFDLAALFQGVPVGLSSFTTNFVSVDYVFADASITLAAGTLTFAPGETVKRIYPAGFNVAAQGLVRVGLSNPAGGELTGETSLTFQGSVPEPRITCLAGGTQMDLARLGEGVAVALSAPSSQEIGADYQWEISGRVLASGKVTFAPGQTRQWISAPAVNPQDYQLLRLALSNPTAAQLANPSAFYLVKTAMAPAPDETILLRRDAQWRYYDTVTSAITGWFNTNFNDNAWGRGAAPLGYGNSPQETTTVGYGSSSSQKYITTYFRTSFGVSNLDSLDSLTFNLLRDDGAVVYLNGAELYRENLATGTIGINTTATSNVSGTATVATSKTVALSVLPAPLREGTNFVAVEIHQHAGDSSDILLDLEIIGNPVPPAAAEQTIYQGVFDRQLTLAWGDPSFQVWQSTNVHGPWSAAPGLPASPLVTPSTNTRQFFRLKKP